MTLTQLWFWLSCFAHNNGGFIYRVFVRNLKLASPASGKPKFLGSGGSMPNARRGSSTDRELSLGELLHLPIVSRMFVCVVRVQFHHNNTCSKQSDNRPHRCRTWTVQRYSTGGISVHSHQIHASLGTFESQIPNGISIGSALFARLTTAIDRKT